MLLSLTNSSKEVDFIVNNKSRLKKSDYSKKLVGQVKQEILIPKEINHKELSENYNVPQSLNELAEKGEKGYLALKIVEIIGEDEVNNLDPETIYLSPIY